MGSGARSSSAVEGPKFSGTLARMLGRLTGAFALVLGAGTLLVGSPGTELEFAL